MSSDLIALVVGITLGLAIVGLGLRRNLGDVTRSWLPRFGKAPEQATLEPWAFGGGKVRHPLSPRQRQLIILFYLLVSAFNAAAAVLVSHGRLLHAINAVLFAVGTVVLARKDRLPS